jgi:putative flippase GtrA
VKIEPNATPELKRFLMFLAVGTLTTGTCYAVFAMLVWLGWHYNLALVAAFAVSSVQSYSMHRVTTFADRRHVRRTLGKYVIALVAVLITNMALLDLLVVGQIFSPLPAQAVATGIVTVLGYRLQTHWVFRAKAKVADVTGVAIAGSLRESADLPESPRSKAA